MRLLSNVFVIVALASLAACNNSSEQTTRGAQVDAPDELGADPSSPDRSADHDGLVLFINSDPEFTLFSPNPGEAGEFNALMIILRSTGPVISTRRSCRSAG